MTETAPPEYSTLPARAVLLIVFLIVSLVMTLVVGNLSAPIMIVVAILWAVKLLYDLVRWVKADKGTRPKMKFPTKSVVALLAVLLCVLYFGYLLMREFSENPL